MQILKNIIISTHAHKIGDVLFSLPLASLLKQQFPDIIIGFIGTAYTQALIEACTACDVFIDKNQFLTQSIQLKGQPAECILHVIPNKEIAKRAKKLKIPLRIGTYRRIYHWWTCNKLINLTRKNSDLHEIQLNLQMLKTFAIDSNIALSVIPELYALADLKPYLTQTNLIDSTRFKLIIHPKSGGSAKEWALSHYIELIQLLDTNHFQIFISGSAKERLELQALFDAVGDKVVDICGQLDLTEYLGLIAHSDALLASSTGPLHLAAALNKHAFGIYAPRSPIFAQRWGPIGKKAQVFALNNRACHLCIKPEVECACMQAIQPQQIKAALELLLC